MSHQSPQRFLADARTGMYGPLYQGMAAREIKPAE
jgi:hypothetical protein